MKALAKTAAIILLLAATIPLAKAQKKITEGVVIYSVTYDLPADKQEMAASFPKEITCYFRGDSTSAVINQGAATVKGVSVLRANYHCLLIDIPSMSKKIAVVMTPDEIQKEKDGLPQFTGKKGTEKQVISGYNCTKVPVTDAKSGAKYDVWVTNDIDIPATSVSRPANIFGGVPVKFVTFNNGLKIYAEIKEVKQESVPAGFFTASKDYETMSYSDLKAMSAGQN